MVRMANIIVVIRRYILANIYYLLGLYYWKKARKYAKNHKMDEKSIWMLDAAFYYGNKYRESKETNDT